MKSRQRLSNLLRGVRWAWGLLDSRASSDGFPLEMLESRWLFSAVPTFHTDLTFNRSNSTAAASSSTVQGFTPAQIAHAYGFDQISLSGGAAADGSGQTIAIVDAFNDPNIVADLGVFDQEFGLSAPPSFKIVNESGGSNLPSTNAGWAAEESLDVEWAHAMAPGANIVLVEASSDQSNTDLLAAVNYARHLAGVSVVSMSWGGSEFEDYSGGETQNQLALDSDFTTPSGHAGITFIASAGDSGFNNGVQWPASSPNVVSVGGTSLETSDSAGTYEFEGPWRGNDQGTSGGFSQFEVEPAYQENAQQSGARSTPDVGYDADPNTGVAVYDSIPYQGSSGWGVAGGTSAARRSGPLSLPLPIRAAPSTARERSTAPPRHSPISTAFTAHPVPAVIPPIPLTITTSATTVTATAPASAVLMPNRSFRCSTGDLPRRHPRRPRRQPQPQPQPQLRPFRHRRSPYLSRRCPQRACSAAPAGRSKCG